MPPTPWLPGAFAGVDRYNPPVSGLGWYKRFMQLSSFTSTVHYLTHSWSGGFSGHPQQWKNAFLEILKQQWGILFIYVCIGQQKRIEQPQSDDGKLWTQQVSSQPKDKQLEKARALGRSHARHLKREFLLKLDDPHEVQGAIVYVDFEDYYFHHEDIQPTTIAYINGIFAEMRVMGDGEKKLAIRPGFYGRIPPTEVILSSTADNADLFLYTVDEVDDSPKVASYREKVGNNFSQPGGRIYSPIEYHPLKATAYSDPDGKPKKPNRMSFLLARQWRFYEHKENDPKGKTYPIPVYIKPGATQIRQSFAFNHVALEPPENDWDFRTSMVRDERFPIATPQIAVAGELVLRTIFDIKVLQSTSQPEPVTSLELVGAVAHTPAPMDESQEHMLEHEAPVIFLDPGSAGSDPWSIQDKSIALLAQSPEVFTLNKQGNVMRYLLAMSLTIAGRWDWYETSVLQLESPPRLRRNRAMAGTKAVISGKLETSIFYVSDQHRLVALRRTDANPWIIDSIQSGDPIVHPFSNIAVTTRLKAGDPPINVTELFFLDENGCLNVVTSSASTWQGSSTRALQGQRTLLHGTSMVAVSPSENETLFFAIGIDCNLHMVRYDASAQEEQRWSPVTKIELQKKDEDRLFAHAHLDAFVSSPNLVYVASITAVNVPCIHVIEKVEYELVELETEPDQPKKQYMKTVDHENQWRLRNGTRLYRHNTLHELSWVDPTVMFESAPGLPDDYPDKVLLNDGKRNIKVGYAFNPFGDVKLSMVGTDLMLWVAGVTMTGTKGYPGDRSELLFIKAVAKESDYETKLECWKRMK